MKRAGRISLVLLLAIIGIVGVAVVVFGLAAGESPETVGRRFMKALALGDVNELTNLSVMDKDTPEDIRKKWDFTVNVAGKHYRFIYDILGSVQPGPDEATVRLQVYRNFGHPGSYAENFEIPMEKVNGTWKVRARELNRQMYPGLPR